MLRFRRWWGLGAMLVVPLVALLVLRGVPSLDRHFFTPDSHLVIVSSIAACALAVAMVARRAAEVSGRRSLTLLGLGCLLLATFMLGHGLTTPGVLGHESNAWVGRFPYLAISSFIAALFLAGRPELRAARRLADVAVVLEAAGVVLTAMVVTDPHRLWGARPVTGEENLADVVSAVSAALGLIVARRHWRAWHLGRDIVQLALCFSAAMTGASVVALEHGKFGRVSWWDYHAYLLAGFGCCAYAVFARARNASTLTRVLESAFEDDPFAHIVEGYPEALRQLIAAVEVKDRYTHGHSARTAELATSIGVQLGLPPDRLRVIARGGYLHDLGKIGIPEHILNKPGALTPEERAIVETHPQRGVDIACHAPSLHETLGVILHHHERVDGAGYPHHLAGAGIPLEARVVAVADVWDALTTDRSYRRGWPPGRALAHIVAGRGTHFDPRAVDALVAVVNARGLVRPDGLGLAETAWEAAQNCHQLDSERQPAVNS